MSITWLESVREAELVLKFLEIHFSSKPPARDVPRAKLREKNVDNGLVNSPVSTSRETATPATGQTMLEDVMVLSGKERSSSRSIALRQPVTSSPVSLLRTQKPASRTNSFLP